MASCSRNRAGCGGGEEGFQRIAANTSGHRRKRSDPYINSTVWGKVLLDSGDLPGAKQRFEQTQAVARETDSKPLLPAALGGMGLVLMQQGKPSEARKAYEQALAIDKEIAYQQESAEISLAMAELDIEEGRAAEGQPMIQDALKVFRAANLNDDEISGHALAARALLAAGKPSDARREIESARSLSARTQNRLVGMGFAIAEAQVLAGSGKAADANKILAEVIANARKKGLIRYELEARLASGEIELKSGVAAEGRKNPGRSGAGDASARGYALIAQKSGGSQSDYWKEGRLRLAP